MYYHEFSESSQSLNNYKYDLDNNFNESVLSVGHSEANNALLISIILFPKSYYKTTQASYFMFPKLVEELSTIILK